MSHPKFFLFKPFKITIILTQVSKLSGLLCPGPGLGAMTDVCPVLLRSEPIYSRTTWKRLIVRLDKHTSILRLPFCLQHQSGRVQECDRGLKACGNGNHLFVSVLGVDGIFVCLQDYGN